MNNMQKALEAEKGLEAKKALEAEKGLEAEKSLEAEKGLETEKSLELEDAPNFSKSVVYQIYPKSFKDSDGDGVGDIKGVIEKLDYLQMLGVDYLWMTPVFVSPQNDNGYDIADYLNIDPTFGTMEDLEELIECAKKRKIKIMLDMVFNHTSTSHAWFQKAIAGDSYYQDYYIFKDGDGGMTPPTNWQSKFGGSAWEYLPELDKWYLHLFDVSQADLNWDNPDVREELKKVVKFWMAKGVEGFRFDVVNLVSKPEVFENDFEGDGRRFYTDGPKIHDYLKELVRDTNMKGLVTVGEMSSTTVEHCVRYSNPKEEELSMCFNFHHLKVDYKDGNKWELAQTDYGQLKGLFKTWQEQMQAGGGWNALFWCNHDQPRIVSRLGDEGDSWKKSAKVLAGLIHLMRGTPYIYQGEEIGMLNAHFDRIEDYRDVESLNYYKILIDSGKTHEEAIGVLKERSRDNGRTPMQWNDERFSGFSQVEPWIAVGKASEHIHARQQVADEDSILHFYRRLISLRKQNELISSAEIGFIDTKVDEVIAYQRRYEEDELLIICNLSNQDLILDLQLEHEVLELKYDSYQNVLSNYEDKKGEIVDKKSLGKLFLRKFELMVLSNRELKENQSL